MKSTCIQQPKNSKYIQISEWQIAFCGGNQCAAFILSHFIGWHDWKLNHDEYYSRANNIAELHGDGRPHNQNAYLFFTMDDLAEGILNLYGKNAINKALQLLEELQVISVHKNPNPRYHFDKTKYFMFYPEICNEWIKESDKIDENQNNPTDDLNESIDCLKVSDRSLQSNGPSLKSNRPSLKKGKAITDTTSNTTSINKTTTVLLTDYPEEAQEISSALIDEGHPRHKLEWPESKSPIRDDFYPDEGTIELAQSQGLTGVTDQEKINRFIRYNQANGSAWADYNPVFMNWLELDFQHEQKKLEREALKPLRRESDDSYSNKPRNKKHTHEDVIAANKGAVSPRGERFCESDNTWCIEGEYEVALDSAVEHIRTVVY